jgi:hypothetical protein
LPLLAGPITALVTWAILAPLSAKLIVAPLALRVTPDLRSNGIAVRRRVFSVILDGVLLVPLPTGTHVLFVAIPLGLFRVLVMLPRVAMLAARTPVAIARPFILSFLAGLVIVTFRPWPFPPTLSTAESLFARRVARFP